MRLPEEELSKSKSSFYGLGSQQPWALSPLATGRVDRTRLPLEQYEAPTRMVPADRSCEPFGGGFRTVPRTIPARGQVDAHVGQSEDGWHSDCHVGAGNGLMCVGLVPRICHTSRSDRYLACLLSNNADGRDHHQFVRVLYDRFHFTCEFDHRGFCDSHLHEQSTGLDLDHCSDH